MVIVDDEFYSRNGIANLIAWKDYGIEIIGYADSGPAGIEIINRLKPDIVLIGVQKRKKSSSFAAIVLKNCLKKSIIV